MTNTLSSPCIMPSLLVLVLGSSLLVSVWNVKSKRGATGRFPGRVWSEQQLAALGRCTLLQQRASPPGLGLHCPSVSHQLTFKACHFKGRPPASNPTWQLSSSMTPGNLFSPHSRRRHYRSTKVISPRRAKMSGGPAWGGIQREKVKKCSRAVWRQWEI